jgi:NAD(P)-dependent dehydrogenase (short-subunit alcohol dehydrogenase family)
MKISEMFCVDGFGVIVTGGASGIGLAYTEVLAENGARVTIMDINESNINKEVQRLTDGGLAVRGMVVDVTDRPAVHRAFDETVAVYGGLDVVFANAGIDPGPGFINMDMQSRNPEGAIENYADERWDRVIDTNLNSVFTTVKAAARHMKPRNSGRIIITTSLASERIEAAIGAAYMVSKAGSAHFMRNTALELAKYNILVNAIAPGPFITNIGGGHAHDPKVQEFFAGTVPLHRMASTEEMKGLALFLASPASSYITGTQIFIDGGSGLGTVD